MVLRMQKSLSLLFVFLFLIAPLASAVGTVGNAHHAADLSGGLASRGETAPTGTVDVKVQNTLNVQRNKEVVRLSIPFGLDELRDLNNIKIVTNTTPQKEVLGGALPNTVQYYPNGSIYRMDVAFQDNFGPNEVKNYKIVIGQYSQIAGSNMTVSSVGAGATVWDGTKTYSVSGDQSGNNAAYVTSSNSSGTSAAYFLTRLGGNQFTPDQVQFSIFWGRPTIVSTDSNRVMATVHLKYDKPSVAYWGGSFKNDVPVVSADVVLNFYRGREMVEILVTKNLNERIYNHNGYVQEFTSLDAGDDTYNIMFGNSHHTTMSAETKSFTTVNETPAKVFKAVNITSNGRAAPAFADWDGDGDLDMVLGAANGTLTAFKNIGNKTFPNFTHDWSAFTGIDVGDYSVPEFADINGDGLMDLVIGRGDGTLVYYKNTGTASVPVWTLDAVVFAGIDAGTFSAPALADLDGDGDLDLTLGNAAGDIIYYKNTGNPMIPVWTLDTATFQTINTGATKKPGIYSDPDYFDIDNNSVLDLTSGVQKGKFGALVFFYNEGSKTIPNCDFLFPGAFNNVRGGDYTHPEWADLNGDGKKDLIVGRADGFLDYYVNMGNSTAQRAGANMQPLENGSYRFWYDQDRNDGQYVTVDQTPDFKDYYVISSPKAKRAVMRVIENFDSIVYKDRYYGNAYPSAGGNVSYYPYLPKEDGYITRGGITFGAYSGGAESGTFISQTGTAAGFVQMPVAAEALTTREVLVDGLNNTQPGTYYDNLAMVQKTPLVVTSPVDYMIQAGSISIEANKGSGQNIALSGTVKNLGGTAKANVDFEFHSSPFLLPADLICSGKVASLPGFGTGTASCLWITTGVAGQQKVFLWVDPKNATKELDEFNNFGNGTIYVPLATWTLSPTYQVSNGVGTNNSQSVDIVVDSTGKPWATWSTYEGKENYDIGVSSFDGTSWATANMISKGNHWSVDPALSADANGKLWLAYSSNNKEYIEYLAKESSRNYWNTKFDAYVAKYDGASWGAPAIVANAFKYNDTDQAPDIAVMSNGSVWLTYRNTHFALYEGGQQINNDPYSDLDILAKQYNTGSSLWSANISIDESAGSQGWWRGPQVSSNNGQTWFIWDSIVGNHWTVQARKNNATGMTPLKALPLPSSGNGERPSIAALPDGTAWATFESQLPNGTAVFASHYDGNLWSNPMQLTYQNRPDIKSVIAVDSLGNPWVAYESLRDGNKEIYLRHFNGVFWSSDIRITQDPSCDEEPAIATGPNGAVWVAWESDRNGRGQIEIFARKVTAGSVPPVIATVSYSPIPVYEDGTVTLTGTVTGGTTKWKGWDLDGKGTDNVVENLGVDAWTTGDTVTWSYQQAGTYHVRFIAVNENDLAMVSKTLDISVVNKAPVAVAGKDRFVAEDTWVTFNGNGSYDTPSDMALGLEYKWDFGDKTPATKFSHNASAMHMYTAYGFFKVNLTVRDDDQELANSTLNVTVYNLKPIVNITIGNLTGVEDQELIFMGHGNDTPSDDQTLAWRWVFGDGTFSDWARETTVKHTYKQAGLYKAQFIVRDKDNMTANASVYANITNVAPTVNEMIAPATAVEDTAVEFAGTGLDTPSDMALGLKYMWDFGDGTNSGWTNVTQLTHNYTIKGDHRIKFTVKDDDGANASQEQLITVTDPAPVATIDPSVQKKVNEDTAVQFKATATDNPSDKATLNYTWDFGDGTNASGTNVSHTYKAYRAAGYTVILTVMDNEGMKGTDSIVVTVMNVKPTAKAVADKTTVKVKDTVTFSSAGTTDTASDISTLKFYWNFGDGSSSTLANPTHIYTTAGAKTVTFTVTDNDGEAASQTLTITVQGGGGGNPTNNNNFLYACVALFIIVLVVLIALSVYSKVRLLGRIIKAVRGEPAKKGPEGDVKIAPKKKVAKGKEEEEAEEEEEEVKEAPKKKVAKGKAEEEEEGEVPDEEIPKKPAKGAAVAAVSKDEEE